MLKIMRACIGVTKPEDLWINCKSTPVVEEEKKEEEDGE